MGSGISLQESNTPPLQTALPGPIGIRPDFPPPNTASQANTLTEYNANNNRVCVNIISTDHTRLARDRLERDG